MNRVGEMIHEMREKSGTSVKQLAKKVGVSESYINEVETGRKVINEKLVERITKVLGGKINDISIIEEESVPDTKETIHEGVSTHSNPRSSFYSSRKNEEIKDVWNEALGNVLKKVPVYKYDLNTVVSTRQLPLISNKIDGHSPDKVFFIQIEENDLAGFRILKGDIAFCHKISEGMNNDFCLIEYKGERVIRQIKKLDAGKVILISSGKIVKTETTDIKSVIFLAKLDRVEFTL